MVASRHHFRLWKAPFTWNGQTVWVGAGTHDIGFAKDKRNGSVTHKIDPNVDGERENIGASLEKGGKVKSMSYYSPPNPVQDATPATGDGATTQMDEFLSSSRSECRAQAIEALRYEIIFRSSLEETYA